MNIEFKSFNEFYDTFNIDANPHVLLVVDNKIYEASYEWSRCQFFLYSISEYIKDDDQRITHFAVAEVPNESKE